MSLDGLTGINVEYSVVLFMFKLLKLDFFNSQPYDKWQYVLRSMCLGWWGTFSVGSGGPETLTITRYKMFILVMKV